MLIDLSVRFREGKKFSLIDFGKFIDPSRSGRPFNSEPIALYWWRITVSLKGPCINTLA
jgi:hypothetical protein